MLNIEKYKDEILNEYRQLMSKNAPYYMDGTRMNKAIQTIAFKHCRKVLRGTSITFKWLFEEYEEPVLDNVERKYLSAVIKPFKGDVDYICKRLNHGGYYIAIVSNGSDVTKLPYFPNNEMYKGMELDRRYKLKELGL